MVKSYLEPAEVELLEKATTNLRDRLLIRVLFRFGCRVSEALALKVEDVDFINSTLLIQHLKVRLKLACSSCHARLGKSYDFCPKCGQHVGSIVMKKREQRKVRTLPVDTETLVMLKNYVSLGGAALTRGKALIFSINRHRAWQIVSKCAKKVGLPSLVNPETGRIHGVSPHRLRDAFAVMAVRRDDSTDSIRMLQEQLGHTDIGTTMRYRKVAGEELKDWYRRLWQADNNG